MTHKVTGLRVNKIIYYVCEYAIEARCKYDTGFMLRYGNGNHSTSKNIISEAMDYTKEYHAARFNIYIDYDIEYYQSELDICKGTVTSENLDAECTHSVKHNYDEKMREDFTSAFPTLNKDEVNVLWTGHKSYVIVDDGNDSTDDSFYNRSFYWNQRIYMTNDIAEGTLTHEMAHFFGAPDHYHEGSEGVICNRETCVVCGGSESEPYSDPCLMGQTGNTSKQVCDGCTAKIIEKRNQNFAISN